VGEETVFWGDKEDYDQPDVTPFGDMIIDAIDGEEEDE
jgi:hypothetical protein